MMHGPINIRFYKALIITVASYGAQSWTMSKDIAERLAALKEKN